MKVIAQVNTDVEVDIDISEFWEAMIGEYQNSNTVRSSMCAMNSLVGFLKRMPDELIAEWAEEHRKIVYDAIVEQAERWNR